MPKKTEKKSPLEKRTRCPKGSVRNTKTGVCVKKVVANVTVKSPVKAATSKKNKTQKTALILAERRECIKNWRLKHIRNVSIKS